MPLVMPALLCWAELGGCASSGHCLHAPRSQAEAMQIRPRWECGSPSMISELSVRICLLRRVTPLLRVLRPLSMLHL